MTAKGARRVGLCIVTLALLLWGCATSMQMSSEELGRLKPTEGLVVGSIEIRGGGDILGRKEWKVYAERVKSPVATLVTPGLEYSLSAYREGPAEVFVAKMEAGDYRFWKLVQPGFSTFTARTNAHFTVPAGRTVYVGKLVIEFPPGFLTVGATFRTLIEDAREPTLEVARKKYGLRVDDVVTDLMRMGN